MPPTTAAEDLVTSVIFAAAVGVAALEAEREKKIMSSKLF